MSDYPEIKGPIIPAFAVVSELAFCERRILTFVVPAKAGTQGFQALALGSCFRGGDDPEACTIGLHPLSTGKRKDRLRKDSCPAARARLADQPVAAGPSGRARLERSEMVGERLLKRWARLAALLIRLQRRPPGYDVGVAQET